MSGFPAISRQMTTVIEQQGIEAALAAPSDGEVAFAIIAMVDGELVQLVTKAARDDRKSWFDLLGLSSEFVEDIDSDYGVALCDSKGVIRTAGTNLIFAEEAQANLLKYSRLTSDGLSSTGEDPNHEADFAFSAESVDGEIGDIAPGIKPHERVLALELYGLVNKGLPIEVPMGLAWMTSDGVIVASSRCKGIQHTLDAFCAVQGWFV